ncbi:MAG: hypothetical protein H8E37_03790 [Planctomycetes bacterium]|nr:hypothetical protein [Planctomycetota bacterium]
MTSTPSPRQPGWVHYSILGLSAILIGIYSTRFVPGDAVSQIVLQTGIVGALGSLGLVLATSKRRARIRAVDAEISIEKRLDRHVDSNMRRIDLETPSPPVPNIVTEPAHSALCGV